MTAHLTFLTDPRYETFGPRVWAIRVDTGPPDARPDSSGLGTFYVRHSRERVLASLVESLAALRAS